MRRLVALQIVMVTVFALTSAAERESAELRATSALFSRFETVFRAGSGLLSIIGPYDGLSEPYSNSLRIPFSFSIAALDELGQDVRLGVLAKAHAVLIGTKDYRAPVGFGMVRSQTCTVVVFSRGEADSVRDFFRRAKSSIAGDLLVWRWSASLGEFGEGDPRPSTIYAAQVGDSYLLLSNDLRELQGLASELIVPGRTFPSLSEMRGWEGLNPHAIWGYRRYRHTAPLAFDPGALRGVALTAQALTFFLDPKSKSGVLRLFSSAAEDVTAENLSSGVLFPPFRALGPGIWQTTFPLEGDERSAERVGQMLGLFGFGIFV